MKTILHIADWHHPYGGAERLLFDTCRMLEERGYVNILCYNDHPRQIRTGNRPEYAIPNLELFTYYTEGYTTLARKPVEQLRAIIAKHRPDVCHIHNFQNYFVTNYLLDTLPTCRSIHDPRLYCFTDWRILPDRRVCPHPLGPDCIKEGCLSKGVLPKTDVDRNAPHVLRNQDVHKRMPQLICESRVQIECMLQNGFDPAQLAWLPNFTDIAPEAEARAFKDAHHNPAKQHVVFVGRASWEKGAHVLIEAAKRLQSRPNITIITAGPELERIQALAAEVPSITVIPGLSYAETRKWYAKADVVVIPSVWLENFCLVGLEAFANLTPVIASEIGGITDWLTPGETGWFFPLGDAAALARRIDAALADAPRLQRMGEAAYSRVAAYYNADLYIDRLGAIYRKTLERSLDMQ